MKRITINNVTVTKTNAIKEAIEYNKKTAKEVEVQNALGDTVIFITKLGKVIVYERKLLCFEQINLNLSNK